MIDDAAVVCGSNPDCSWSLQQGAVGFTDWLGTYFTG
jgi:hypothetical protein